jgi:asparagine synthase (glutamine-hydrolysing)
MFAFAVYNSLTDKLFLSVDRFGQKPLYYFYYKSDSCRIFAFSSELNSLSQHPQMPKELNYQAIHDFLSLQCIHAPNSVYKNVHKLPAAHWMEISQSSDDCIVKRYWNLSFDNSVKTDVSYSKASLQLRELVVDSVKKRLMSDVPLGAFLSGGLDSTIIVAIMRKILKIPVKTFTISFNEKGYDESQYARESADFLETEHHVKVVNPSDFDLLQKIALQFGEPFGDSSMLPTYLLSQYTGENVKVALSGDGADEIFIGYYRYLMMRIASNFDFIPHIARKTVANAIMHLLPGYEDERSKTGKLRRILDTLSSSRQGRYLNLINRFSEESKYKIYGPIFNEQKISSTQEIFDRLLSNASSRNYVEQISECDIQSYLPGDILVKVDIASMSHSLEVRSPYLDHNVAQFAASLPLTFKQKGKQRKRILQDAFSDILPPCVMNRKKMGFGVPVAYWLRSSWREQAKELLFYGDGVKKGFFNKKGIERMFDLHCSGKTDCSYPLWSMLMFEIWLANSL